MSLYIAVAPDDTELARADTLRGLAIKLGVGVGDVTMHLSGRRTDRYSIRTIETIKRPVRAPEPVDDRTSVQPRETPVSAVSARMEGAPVKECLTQLIPGGVVVYPRHMCGSCGGRVKLRDRYCANCGARLKWYEAG